MATVLTDSDGAASRNGGRSALADLIAGGAALLLVGVAVIVGFRADVRLYGDEYFGQAPPLFGEWPVLGTLSPHVGAGSVFAVLLAVATVAWGPRLAERLAWPALLGAAYLLAVGWIVSLALVDGWDNGFTNRIEYLGTAADIDDIPRFVDTFTGGILGGQPDSWRTHVAAHPPGATLVYVWLDRIGIGGPSGAAITTVLAGALVAVAVPVTISALGRRDLARAAVPFVALVPGAIWLGVSADGMFAGVTATGVALLAVGARHLSPGLLGEPSPRDRSPTAASPVAPRRSASRGVVYSVAGGVLLGFGIYLSYGLLLLGSVALGVVLASRSWRALVLAVLGALAVAAVFTTAGFWWLDGYHLLLERYYDSVAQHRPYWYWLWTNIACLVLVVGPAVVAGLRRCAPGFGVGLPGLDRPRFADAAPVLLVVRGAVLAVLAADLSGLSKAEVERIWLPFAVWLVLAAAMLPAASRRWWLAAQASVALVVNHVLLTAW